jgi:predicted TIM-barrel fold metal-dependent hydrolase
MGKKESQMKAVDSAPIVDADSHVTEPADLWTSRLASKWLTDAPRVERNVETGVDEWWVGSSMLLKPGSLAMAGWGDYIPSCPKTYEEMDPGAFDPKQRLVRMDEYGVWAQILYPNILGFFSGAIQQMEPELRDVCVYAYNDFITEFASENPDRLVPLMCLPFWDVEASVQEIRRCHELGHRGIVFGWEWEKIGLPPLSDDHWEPLLLEAQERNLPISFHVGVNTLSKEELDRVLKRQAVGGFDRTAYALDTAMFVVGNIRCIARIILDGTCERYPSLPFVSVESGFGYLPYLLELLDWQFFNSGAHLDKPNWPKPSDIFKRQIYGTFWFERSAVSLMDEYADNIMFSTDFPHPTSLCPGPASLAEPAREAIQHSLGGLSDSVVSSVIGRTASKLYGIDLPAQTAMGSSR